VGSNLTLSIFINLVKYGIGLSSFSVDVGQNLFMSEIIEDDIQMAVLFAGSLFL